MQRSVRRPALCPGGLPAEIRLIRGNLLVDVHAIHGLAADRNTANAVLGDGGEYLAHTVKSPTGTLSQGGGREGVCPLPDAADGRSLLGTVF